MGQGGEREARPHLPLAVEAPMVTVRHIERVRPPEDFGLELP